MLKSKSSNRILNRRKQLRVHGPDRRGHRRINVDLFINRFLDGQPYMCRMVDISRTGARIMPIIEPEVLIRSPEKAAAEALLLAELTKALDGLAKFDERKAKVVEMRFFGGLSVEETAEVLKISPQSVMRDWKLAKAWLARDMGADH